MNPVKQVQVKRGSKFQLPQDLSVILDLLSVHRDHALLTKINIGNTVPKVCSVSADKFKGET